MTGHAAWTEHYFPPPGHAAHAARDPDRGFTWFPMHLLLEQLGRCGQCENPATYIASTYRDLGEPSGYAAAICLAACDEHVCGLTQVITGHEHCPKCHNGWARDTHPPYRPVEGEDRDE